MLRRRNRRKSRKSKSTETARNVSNIEKDTAGLELCEQKRFPIASETGENLLKTIPSEEKKLPEIPPANEKQLSILNKLEEKQVFETYSSKEEQFSETNSSEEKLLLETNFSRERQILETNSLDEKQPSETNSSEEKLLLETNSLEEKLLSETNSSEGKLLLETNSLEEKLLLETNSSEKKQHSEVNLSSEKRHSTTDDLEKQYAVILNETSPIPNEQELFLRSTLKHEPACKASIKEVLSTKSKEQQETTLSQVSKENVSPQVTNEVKCEEVSNQTEEMFANSLKCQDIGMTTLNLFTQRENTIMQEITMENPIESEQNLSTADQNVENIGDKDQFENRVPTEKESSCTESEELAKIPTPQLAEDNEDNDSIPESRVSKMVQLVWHGSWITQTYVDSIFTSMPMVLIYFALLITSIKISLLGFSNLSECPLSTAIPLYVAYLGLGIGFVTLCCIWSTLKNCFNREFWTPQPGLYLISYHVISMLLLIILIEYHHIQPSEEPSSALYCDPDFYSYTYYVVYCTMGAFAVLPLLFFNRIVSILSEYATFGISCTASD